MTGSGATPTKVYRRKIMSTLAEVDTVCAEIRMLLASTDFNDCRFAIELLAHETLCNAVAHGNRRVADKKVEFEMRMGRAWVRLLVTDEGPGFDWHKQPTLSDDTSATSGRGLVLYSVYAERVQFNQLGNQVILWLRKNRKN